MNSEVPTSVNVLVMISVPLCAFALPFWLARRLPDSRRRARTSWMLIAVFPAILLTVLVATTITPSWYAGFFAPVHDLPSSSRFPPSLGALLIRAGIMGPGTFLILWGAGLVGEMLARQSNGPSDAKQESKA